ncbi:branched-chain amino acid ABC transporter permease [Vineibacter terrae]|uniref:Branched-chain amino acid ABC transporter permease n=1 Tax=Vineibacter terrae TaxID=2586908 RepID=A0A5C8PBK6_9HYPH|nr:branched-chain amino acid ABC transporter permease [Vineibacter terrae]TXL70439.1 branched-chain amino acid ABC transporter permease [Vineibacter terrae]
MNKNLLALAAVVLLAVVAPMVIPISIANEIIVIAIFAMATNLVIGVAGLYSFGQAMFFGAGAYLTGYSLTAGGLSLVPSILIAIAGAAALAGIVGAVIIRRSGFYFMMLTFAFNQMAFYVVLVWSGVTGGEDGMAGIKRAPVGGLDLNDRSVFYAFCAVLFVASYVILRQIKKSPLGLVLEAAKENPRRMASLGYSVHGAQLAAFMISGAFAGLAGSLYVLLYRFVPIDSISWIMSGNVVFMVVIGGMSSMVGPIMGAAVFVWLQGLFSLLWAQWALLFGLFIIFVVFTLRGGLIELFKRVARIRRAGEAHHG